jgi:glycosyltransferase involved in cell wall biosynthesis
MGYQKRKEGISVLIACQNEEATLALCVISFLDFADEIILVDNGSTDRSKEIARDLQSTYKKKIEFYDVPELLDLYQNRQYALLKSNYQWIARIDSDYIAYTSGEYNIRTFRKTLLERKNARLLQTYSIPQPNVVCDFWHTGREITGGKKGPKDPGRYVSPPVAKPMLRIYRYFPGFRFKRLGRWEGTSFNRLLRWMRVELDRPLWMHCNIKSARSYLFRSERTNWRQLGDFKHYPTLESYVRQIIKKNYHTSDLDQAAEIYLQTNVYPYLQKYDPEKYYPYPSLVREQMARNSIYILNEVNGRFHRKYLGVTSPSQWGVHP